MCRCVSPNSKRSGSCAKALVVTKVSDRPAMVWPVDSLRRFLHRGLIDSRAVGLRGLLTASTGFRTSLCRALLINVDGNCDARDQRHLRRKPSQRSSLPAVVDRIRADVDATYRSQRNSPPQLPAANGLPQPATRRLVAAEQVPLLRIDHRVQ